MEVIKLEIGHLQDKNLYILIIIGLTHYLFFCMVEKFRNKDLHNAQKTANSVFC
jgi:hypothetical protein